MVSRSDRRSPARRSSWKGWMARTTKAVIDFIGYQGNTIVSGWIEAEISEDL